MYCATCGAEVVDGASYCGACGAYLDQRPPEAADHRSSLDHGRPTAPSDARPAAPGPGGDPPGAETTYAGFWLRAGALILDSMILIGLAIGFAVVLVLFDAELLVEQGTARAAVRELIGGMLSWLYYAGLESSSLRATIGKRALGLQVTDLAGRQVSFARATGRYFAKVLSALTLGLGYLMAAFTDRKQTLHDMVSGCLVVTPIDRST